MAAIASRTSYTITVSGGLTGGTISADKTSAAAGETVALTAAPNSGYSFGAWSVKVAKSYFTTIKSKIKKNKDVLKSKGFSGKFTFHIKDSDSDTVASTFSFTF